MVEFMMVDGKLIVRFSQEMIAEAIAFERVKEVVAADIEAGVIDLTEAEAEFWQEEGNERPEIAELRRILKRRVADQVAKIPRDGTREQFRARLSEHAVTDQLNASSSVSELILAGCAELGLM